MTNLFGVIRTRRLVLRVLKSDNAEELQLLLARNREYMLPWVPWAKDEPQTIEEKRARIREWRGEFYLDRKYVYGIFEPENVLVGLAFLFTRRGPDILEIGYIVDEKRSGRGYATESTYALSKLCFESLEIAKVELHCSAANIGSSRIPEKLGYQLESKPRSVVKNEKGEREVDMIWGMFKEEFERMERLEPVEFQYEVGS